MLIAVTWYYSQSDLAKEKKKNIDELYSFGTLDAATDSISWTNGCTDSDALNYDEDATEDDGSCFYNIGCCDLEADNYDASADSCNAPNNNALTCDYGQGGGWTDFDGEVVMDEETGTLKTPCSHSCSWINNIVKPECCGCIEPNRDYNTYSY